MLHPYTTSDLYMYYVTYEWNHSSFKRGTLSVKKLLQKRVAFWWHWHKNKTKQAKHFIKTKQKQQNKNNEVVWVPEWWGKKISGRIVCLLRGEGKVLLLLFWEGGRPLISCPFLAMRLLTLECMWVFYSQWNWSTIQWIEWLASRIYRFS